jgi:hypothetical protein
VPKKNEASLYNWFPFVEQEITLHKVGPLAIWSPSYCKVNSYNSYMLRLLQAQYYHLWKVKESFERLGKMPFKPLNGTLRNFFNKEVEMIVMATTYIFKQF